MNLDKKNFPQSVTPLMDIHCHLNMMERDISEILAEAEKYNVKKIITIGTTPEDLPFVLKCTEEHSQVYGTLGTHPHDAVKWSEEVDVFIRKKALNSKIVAIGEIGLDYFYEHSPRNTQQKVFASGLQTAKDLNLPIQIHVRNAQEDIMSILKDFPTVRGVIHCFSGTQKLADEALEHGMNISISGIVTFKKAEDLRGVVRNLPLDRIHVETDAPYLTPVPHRGKSNEPAYVCHVAQLVADLKNISLEELAQQVEVNNHNVFPKLKNI